MVYYNLRKGICQTLYCLYRRERRHCERVYERGNLSRENGAVAIAFSCGRLLRHFMPRNDVFLVGGGHVIARAFMPVAISGGRTEQLLLLSHEWDCFVGLCPPRNDTVTRRRLGCSYAARNDGNPQHAAAGGEGLRIGTAVGAPARGCISYTAPSGRAQRSDKTRPYTLAFKRRIFSLCSKTPPLPFRRATKCSR